MTEEDTSNSVEIEDPEILTYTSKRDYGAERDELETGSPYWMIFTFTGVEAGTTTVSVYGRSPIIENNDSIYTAVVDENLNVTLKSVRKISTFFMYRDADIDYNTHILSLMVRTGIMCRSITRKSRRLTKDQLMR